MKNWLTYLIIRILSGYLQCLPHSAVLRFGAFLGRLSYRFIHKRRRIALTNIQTALDSPHDQEVERIARESFEEVGKTFTEFLCFPKWVRRGLDRYVTVQGRENLYAALDQGHGAVVFIGHFGNWELQALVYGTLVVDPAAIAFPLKNAHLNAWVNQCRELTGLKILSKYHAARDVFRRLKSNQAVGFIADQNAGREGVFVDLFGRLASSSRGPVTFALRTGAPILISLDERQPNGHHVLRISEPFHPAATGNLEQDVIEGTQFLMKSLEAEIRSNPSQWMWMHDRWKSRPDSTWLEKRAQRRGYETTALE